jgi:hypothetical protein
VSKILLRILPLVLLTDGENTKQRTPGEWSFKKGVELKGEEIYPKRNLHRTPDWKTPLGRPRRIEKDDIKKYVKFIIYRVSQEERT